MVDIEPDNVMRRSRTENANYVIDQIRALGLVPDPSSRVMRMHRTLNRGYVPSDDPDFLVALEAERDLQHLGFVFDQMHAHRDNPEFRALVKRALKDSVLPQQNRVNSPGRDTQFELYLAAICQNAGLLPVDCEEPDVTCAVEGTRFGIAAKRLKTLSQLKEHVRKGARQIANVQLPGIIALDFSLAWNRDNLPIVSQIHSQFYVMLTHTRGNQLFDDHHQNMYRWVANSGVLGIVIFDFRVRLRPDRQWGLDGMMNWLPTTHDDERANHDYKVFYNSFMKGVPNLTNLTPGE
jgi:hypothetical protein